MLARFPLAALCLALAVAVPGLAEHCTGPSAAPTTLDTDPLGAHAVPRYYVVNEVCQPECLFSIWAFEESNGFDGLQYSSESEDYTCHGMIDSDTFVF